MNLKAIVPLGLAGILGLVAALAAWHLSGSRSGPSAAPHGQGSVVVLNQDVAPGTALSASQLSTMPAVADQLKQGTFTSADQVVGRVTAAPMVKGQPVFEALLTPRGSGAGLQALVPPGMRAMTLEVNEFNSVAGLLAPGCHVDVICTVSGDHGTGNVARTIVQNVTVTAVGKRLSPAVAGSNADTPNRADASGAYKSVTLLLSPRDAEAVELACTMGQPRLVLRNGNDQSVGASDGITLAALRGPALSPAQPLLADWLKGVLTPTARPVVAPLPVESAAAPAPRVWTVDVNRGGVHSIVSLPLAINSAQDALTRVPLDSELEH